MSDEYSPVPGHPADVVAARVDAALAALAAEERRFVRLVDVARESGLELRVTPGVLIETATHINLCRACARATKWEGQTPFLMRAFTATGSPLAEFPGWVERFAGEARPADDIADYLHSRFEVEVQSLEEQANAAPQELRGAVQEIWQAAHDRRRSELDPMVIHQLVAHDVENYLGVVMRRKREGTSALGYTSWWLTLDNTAFAVRSILRDTLGAGVPDSPVLSPDFLVNYLALGPIRNRVHKTAEERLPVVLDLSVWDLPKDVIALAESVRSESSGAQDAVIRRRVRDELDKARRRMGPVAREGLAGVEGMVRERLEQNRRKKKAETQH